MKARAGHDRILSVAEDLFARRGYKGVSVQQIARNAHTSSGLIYYHFADKQTLYQTLIKKSIELILFPLDEIAKLDEPAPDKIRRFIRSYLELLFKEEDLVHILAHEFANLEGPMVRYVIQQSEKAVNILAGIVREGIEAGDFKDINPLLAGISLFGMLNTYATATIVFRRDLPGAEMANFSADNLAEVNAAIFLEGLTRC